jgi:hypothetical protein
MTAIALFQSIELSDRSIRTLKNFDNVKESQILQL